MMNHTKFSRQPVFRRGVFFLDETWEYHWHNMQCETSSMVQISTFNHVEFNRLTMENHLVNKNWLENIPKFNCQMIKSYFHYG